MEQKGYYRFGSQLTAKLPVGTDTEVLSELWNGFCCRMGELKTEIGENDCISIGNAHKPILSEQEEFSVCIRPDGICIVGRDHAALMRGFSSLMLQIEMFDDGISTFRIPCGDLHGAFSIARRMIHLCVFPSTSLTALRRLVRFCGILSYTHVVLEFWGMLRYDCLKELAWEQAYSKDEIRPIVREARALGMEPIPMINHLGHASFCRINSGKHVVLDQNPRLQPLFTPDGWCWNIFSERPKQLLKHMRQELSELFGTGDYFHIGCDEALIFSSNYYPLDGLCAYLKELTAEVISEGRRPILWGDMIVPYDTDSDSPEARAKAKLQEEKMRPLMYALHPQSVIADWHYDIKTAPVPSTLIFQRAGFDVLGCPWDNSQNIDAHRMTAADCQTYGLMMTTWHTLSKNLDSVLYFARRCGLPKADWSDACGHRCLEPAVLLRKLSPEGIAYADCGFCEKQLHDTFEW